MSATKQIAEIKYVLVDASKAETEMYLSVGVDQADNAAMLAHNHTDQLRPSVTTSKLVRVVITLPHLFSDGLEQATNGQLVAQKAQFHLTPNIGRNPTRLTIPAFKQLCFSDANLPTGGKRTRVKKEGAVATLVDSWITGIGGVKPVNARGVYFDGVSEGLLKTEGNT